MSGLIGILGENLTACSSLLAFVLAAAGCGGTPAGLGGDSLAGPDEHFEYQCQDDVDIDVDSLVSGGSPPYECELFVGPGGGNAPDGVSLEDCHLGGTAGALDVPGYYGYMVRVTDAAGAVVDVPIGCFNGLCNNAGSAVTIDPDPGNPLITTAGVGYSWTVTLPDVDIPCSVSDCSACNGCISTRLMPGPIPQMELTEDMVCTNPGTVCLVRDTEQADQCPDVVTSTRVVTVKDHDPIRDDGGPAWETVPITIGYSGPDPDTCGPKQFECHAATLTLSE